MVRRLGIYIANYHAKFVLVNELPGNLTGDYFAEETVLFRHRIKKLSQLDFSFSGLACHPADFR
jgi:hypothetical protein